MTFDSVRLIARATESKGKAIIFASVVLHVLSLRIENSILKLKKAKQEIFSLSFVLSVSFNRSIQFFICFCHDKKIRKEERREKETGKISETKITE